MGTAWTSIELEFDWVGDYDRADPDTGYNGGWENITLERAYFDLTDFKMVDGRLTKIVRTVEFVLTPEQTAQIEALFSEAVAEQMED